MPSQSITNHFYIFATILLTIYGQVVIKWQVNATSYLPNESKLSIVLKLLSNPWIISGFLSAFLAALSWLLAMTKFPLSYAYPFTSLTFVLIPFASLFLFREPITLLRSLGTAIIVLGLIVGSRG